MILLTGLTGLTGSYISNFLSENKLQARALVRNLSSSSYLKELGFELVVGNLEDE